MAYKPTPTVSDSPITSLTPFSTTLCLAPPVTAVLATLLFRKQVRCAPASGSFLLPQHLPGTFSLPEDTKFTEVFT